MARPLFLAFDLGAESGRAVAGILGDRKIELEVLHRFPNRPALLEDGFYWDVLSLYHGIRDGLLAAGRYSPSAPAGVSCDSWGVDFALLDRRGRLLANPRHYRDRFFQGSMERVLEICPADEIYGLTGIQFLPLNTIYQLFCLSVKERPLLEAADRMLMIADLFNFFLGGDKKQEYTLASTSQLCDARTRGWAPTLFEKLGMPFSIMPPTVPPASVVGRLRGALADEAGWPAGIPVVAGVSHDTAGAVAACPAAEGEHFAFLSSGTWSLLGIERKEPELGTAARQANFTNEGGLEGTYRFLRNITGLWILQECRRCWAIEDGRETPYHELVEAAAREPSFLSLVDVDDASFLAPPNMVEALAAFCRRTGQPVPARRAGFARVILEGLALRYMSVFRDLVQFSPAGSIDVLHVIGGGSRNELLNRFTADALGVPVVAGPVEATAAGNIISQALAVGFFSSLAEGRRVVKDSFPLTTYEPGSRQPWQDALAGLEKICSR